ncbi:unnamed protein product [Trichogramma brassicae]|uniref:C2 domain-containing protein n=1 Tax=Trichogramma brassicae TaxID=86971 RepID=A0A6H5IB14_9HYME|nr:unnamed protein product [Trichogramma brassicae]
MPYELAGPAGDDEKMINLDANPAGDDSIRMPDEEMRTRRRGSQLPNINMIKALANAAAAQQSSSSATSSVAPAQVSRTAAPAVVAPAVAGPVARVTAGVEDRELARQGSLADGEGIKIVIHDVDCDIVQAVRVSIKNYENVIIELIDDCFSVPRTNTKRKVVLRKDVVVEKGHRKKIFEKNVGLERVKKYFFPRSFGMRVVGGKIGSDNRLYAVIVWTVSGGPAEKAGLQQGDKSLFKLHENKIYKHTHIILRIFLCRAEKISNCYNDLVSSEHKYQCALTEQLAKERQVTGRVQIQLWYEADRKELVVSVLAADDLCAREDTGYGTQPEAFAKLDLVSPRYAARINVANFKHSRDSRNDVEFDVVRSGDVTSLKTDVSEPTHNPIWNATLNFTNVTGEQLLDRLIEVTLWDYCPDRDSMFMGGCSIDLTSAFEADRAVWYRLEDPRGLRSGRSPHCSPRGSLSIELAQRLLRRTDLRERSYSEDTQSDSGSPEPYFLHPDHAWLPNSRRGSSQSEQLEIEPYELSKDYSRSLPGSRRSSFQSQAGVTDSKRGSMGEADVSGVHYSRERRRSSFARPMRDQEEILETLRSLKAQGRGELSRTMSLSGEKRRPNLRQKTFRLNMDTYIKTYLRAEERWLHKRKTRVVRHSRNPQFRQTLKYPSCDALGRNLLVMLWEKKQGFESNQGLGGAEIELDSLALTRLTIGWYRLFPIHTLGTQTADSP